MRASNCNEKERGNAQFHILFKSIEVIDELTASASVMLLSPLASNRIPNY